jgi:hypothetical protein
LSISTGQNWTPKADVRAFALIPSEITVGICDGPDGCDLGVPQFVSQMIQTGQSTDLITVESFADIFSILKQNHFTILEDVQMNEVSDFVSCLERSET